MRSRVASMMRSSGLPQNVTSKWTGTNWYVDSVGGSDSNNGLSAGTAFQTIAKLLTVVQALDTVNLARGSYWREQLLFNFVVRVRDYGSGALPILDGADVVAGGAWSKTGGLTNVYQITLIAANTGAINYAMYENGLRLIRATSSANCDATPGSFSCPDESSFVQGQPFTMYCHTTDGSNPASNGQLYEATARQWSCYIGAENQPGAELYNIAAWRAGHHNGPIEIGRSAWVSGCMIQYGESHGCYLDSGSCVNCQSYDCEFGFDFVANKGSSADGRATYIACVANLRLTNPAIYPNNGFFVHGNTVKDVAWYNCVSANHKVGFGYDAYNANSTCVLKYCVATCPAAQGATQKGYELSAEDAPATLTITIDRCACDMAGTMLYSFASHAGAVVNMTRCSMISRSTGDVAIRSVLQMVNVDQCTFVGLGASYGIAFIDSGSLSFNRSIFTGYANPIQTFSGVAYVADNNVDQGGSTWRYQGTAYVSYASWKAATGQDANTSTADPLFVHDPLVSSYFAVQGGSPAVSRHAGCTAP